MQSREGVLIFLGLFFVVIVLRGKLYVKNFTLPLAICKNMCYTDSVNVLTERVGILYFFKRDWQSFGLKAAIDKINAEVHSRAVRLKG